MVRHAGIPRRRMPWITFICAVCVCTSPAAVPAGSEKALLHNPSFEAVAPIAAPPKGNKYGEWLLNSELLAPAGWRLSSAYPGELEVIEGGAAEGQRFLRVAAGSNRAAHLAQECPRLLHGLAYEVSLRYRGGPVELKVYEYDGMGKLKADRAFARGVPTAVRDGAWCTLAGIYMMPTGIAKVTLALAIPGGGEADLDDLRIERFERSAERINVRDFGANGSEFETTADATAGATVVTVQDIGDLRVGHQVAISKCSPHITDGRVWGKARGEGASDFDEQVQARGYDGTLGNWTAYLLDFKGTNVHHNVINNCAQLVNLEVFGGPTAVLADNLLSRGDTDDVKVAVEIRGRFKITDNQFSGFDEPGSLTLMLHPDPAGRPSRSVCKDNEFDQCTTPIQDNAVP